MVGAQINHKGSLECLPYFVNPIEEWQLPLLWMLIVLTYSLCNTLLPLGTPFLALLLLGEGYSCDTFVVLV